MSPDSEFAQHRHAEVHHNAEGIAISIFGREKLGR
jgi:hypothetical protein